MSTASARPIEYRGHVANGVVVLDEPVRLPDGTQVRVTQESPAHPALKSAGQAPTWYEVLKPVIGAVKGMPEDLAENHDHYIHGTPKRS